MVAINKEEALKNLKRDGLIFGVYISEDNKILICKTPFFHQLSLPCVKLNEGEDISYQFDPMFRNEFQITPEIKQYLELTRGFYEENNIGKNGNFICLHIEEYAEYPLKKKPMLKPSGNYSEMQYITYEEALELYHKNEITNYSMFYIFRIKEVLDENMANNRNNV